MLVAIEANSQTVDRLALQAANEKAANDVVIDNVAGLHSVDDTLSNADSSGHDAPENLHPICTHFGASQGVFKREGA
jgi:hypothetical protein